MTDQEILDRIGHSDADVTEGIKALCENPGEAESTAGAYHDADEAAAAIGGNCTAADIQRFVSARAGAAPGTAMLFYAPVADA